MNADGILYVRPVYHPDMISLTGPETMVHGDGENVLPRRHVGVVGRKTWLGRLSAGVGVDVGLWLGLQAAIVGAEVTEDGELAVMRLRSGGGGSLASV